MLSVHHKEVPRLAVCPSSPQEELRRQQTHHLFEPHSRAAQALRLEPQAQWMPSVHRRGAAAAAPPRGPSSPRRRRGSDPLQEYAYENPLSGVTMVEAGFLIKEGILKSLLRVGDVARIMESTRVGQGAPHHVATSLGTPTSRGSLPPTLRHLHITPLSPRSSCRCH